MLLSITLNPSVDHALFVERLKPNDTNRVLRTERDAGGKGVNLSRVFRELGGDTLATGFLGGGTGAYVRSVLERQGVGHAFVEVAEDTRLNFSVEDNSGQPPTAFSERGPHIGAPEWQKLLTVVREHLPSAQWVAIGGSLPPGAPPDAFRQLAELAHEAGCRVALDADGDPLRQGLLGMPNLLKPNDREASRLLGRDVATRDEAIAAARDILRMIENGGSLAAFQPTVILSRGALGAILVQPGLSLEGVPPTIVAKSTIGSGDSLLAGYLWANVQGHTPEECLRWGIAAGAATATTDGSEIGRRGVIEALLPQVAVNAL